MTKAPVAKSKPLTQKKIIFVVLGLLLGCFILVAVYYISSFGYTVSRIRCGHKPFIEVGSYEPTDTYIGPNDPMYQFEASNWGSKYYCTQQQAQAAGLTPE